MSRSDFKLDRERALLAVVDVQEAFRPAVLDFELVAESAAVLVESATILGLPILVSEQYPRGLGSTVPEVAGRLDGVEAIEKVCFSALDAEKFKTELDSSGRDQILICGIETHVCVCQTALGMLSAGLTVHVARDAVSSRTGENREVGLHRMEQAGAVVTSVETALFEMLERAGTEEFKAIQKLIK